MFWKKSRTYLALARPVEPDSPGLRTARKAVFSFIGNEEKPIEVRLVTNQDGYPIAARGEEIYAFIFGEHEDQLVVKIHVLSQLGEILNSSHELLTRFCYRKGQLLLS